MIVVGGRRSARGIDEKSSEPASPPGLKCQTRHGAICRHVQIYFVVVIACPVITPSAKRRAPDAPLTATTSPCSVPNYKKVSAFADDGTCAVVYILWPRTTAVTLAHVSARLGSVAMRVTETRVWMCRRVARSGLLWVGVPKSSVAGPQ